MTKDNVYAFIGICSVIVEIGLIIYFFTKDVYFGVFSLVLFCLYSVSVIRNAKQSMENEKMYWLGTRDGVNYCAETDTLMKKGISLNEAVKRASKLHLNYKKHVKGD